MSGGIVRVSRFVLSALLISVSGCAATKPATDYTYQDVPPEQIANRIFLADAIAEVEKCEPPFADVRIVRPNFLSPPPAADGCGGSARAAAGPEAAQTRALSVTLLHCLDRAGFTQRGPGDPSLESYGIGSGDLALDNAAQECSDETGYGSAIAAQRVRTLKSVLGLHESEINEITRLRAVLTSYARPGDGAERGRFGLPE